MVFILHTRNTPLPPHSTPHTPYSTLHTFPTLPTLATLPTPHTPHFALHSPLPTLSSKGRPATSQTYISHQTEKLLKISIIQIKQIYIYICICMSQSSKSSKSEYVITHSADLSRSRRSEPRALKLVVGHSLEGSMSGWVSLTCLVCGSHATWMFGQVKPVWF